MELCCLRTDPPGVSLKSSCSRAGQCLGQARLIPSGICRLIYCPQEQLGPYFAQFLLSQPNVEALHDALARSNCCTNQSCFLWSFPTPVLEFVLEVGKECGPSILQTSEL